MILNDDSQKNRLADLLAFVENTKTSKPEKPAKRQRTQPAEATQLPDYYFNQDESPSLEFDLKPTVDVRPYQREALDAIIDTTSKNPKEHFARSGIVVLPCGAGKTLTSILVASSVKRPILVVCSTIIAAEQFAKEFLNFTNLMASKTGMFAGAKKWPFNGPAGVLFTTYTMLVESKNRTIDSKRMSTFIEKTDWGLVILDEVHCVPANNFSKAIAKINTRMRLGLTATMLREDEKIGDLETLVGPTVYHAKWKELADKGYIAKVICTQIESNMTPYVKSTYDSIQTQNNSLLGHGHHLKSLLAILNPKKMQICQRLIQYHEAKGDKILVFCDHIDALKLYAEKTNRPLIYGGTPTDEARILLSRFQIDVPKNEEDLTWNQIAARRSLRANQINTLFLSRIGDTSLDLPAATVLIQVSSHFGSRRQEAQRLGRILRAKKRNEKGFYSRFYTLVTNDTLEVQFSEKRRQFLEEDCGYGYQIWQVGDEHEGGWTVEANEDTTTPLDDEVKTDPLTCTIQGGGSRLYANAEDEKQLVDHLTGLKKCVIEVEDEMDTVPTTAAKRKRT
ncbi:P-loop containing nucleoside triphosphate hydrolase protein [Pilobolus umbonatus]|nr:P-loop containing nucleoside triphosphate hydrolase protein [Pilobolus umbonatus]